MSFILGAAIGGGLNLLSDVFTSKSINSRISGAQEQLRDLITDEDEIRQEENRLQKVFNTQLSQLLNTTAFRSRGFGNQNVATAATIAPSIGSQAQAMLDLRQNYQDKNANITSQIAQLEANKSNPDPFASLAEGAISGGIAQYQMEKLQKLQKDKDSWEQPDPYNGPGGAPASNYSMSLGNSNTGFGGNFFSEIGTDTMDSSLPDFSSLWGDPMYSNDTMPIVNSLRLSFR